MVEPLWNIGFTCSAHSSRPDPCYSYSELPLEHFIGNYVKLGFPTGHPKHKIEHMWVKVICKAETKGEELRGALDNDPVYADATCGDLIEFKRTEIEAFEAAPPQPKPKKKRKK